MDLSIRPASVKDVELLSALYHEVTAALADTSNITSWSSDTYPTRETAERLLEEGGVFLAEVNGQCIGTVHLSYRQEREYHGAPWSIPAGKNEVLVLRTLAVHPLWRGRGIAKALLANADIVAAQWHCQTIRLDVYDKNTPAIHLYEAFGYRYVSTVEMRYHDGDSSHWYRLYERPVLMAAKQLFWS